MCLCRPFCCKSVRLNILLCLAPTQTSNVAGNKFVSGVIKINFILFGDGDLRERCVKSFVVFSFSERLPKLAGGIVAFPNGVLDGQPFPPDHT
jgi:hypothetical protein